ncbi:DUF3078 domain-containing protein [Pontibacter anaerobius]|uniref:DUF3078 domain-containing protein n=1 Tax=Pontibacter anaerobius TaxID=2993940 RepID=A0ABT3RLG3_9BACT|nr:DUF3078 domain-containing protein [Pontibacter anaerobius]MCX2742132.1 DUF3078 domain-containing protein [Pontibacter anaerobius]
MFFTYCRSFLLLSTFILLYTLNAAAQAPADTVNIWDFGGIGTVNFSQVSLSNWAAGGQNTVSVLGNANLYANYAKGKNTWNNSLDLTYGLVKLEGRRVQKSDDKLELNLKYGYRASKKWFYTTQLNIKTQLTPTYTITRDTLRSNFFSPAFVLASLGMDYKPNEKLSVFISPFTGKFTVVANQGLADKGAFGVEAGEKDIEGNIIPGTGEHLRKEFGGYVNVRYKTEILKNISLQSKLDLFSNYLRKPENVDLNWENLINFKVNKVVSASFFAHMIYDDDIMVDVDRDGDEKTDGRGPRLQLKQTMGIGISYKFK